MAQLTLTGKDKTEPLLAKSSSSTWLGDCIGGTKAKKSQNDSSNVETSGAAVKLEDLSYCKEEIEGTTAVFSLNFIYEITTFRGHTIVNVTHPDKMSNPRQQWDLGRLWPRSFLNLYKDAFVFPTQS